MNNETGVNVEAIRKLCLEINNYSEKIKNKLSQISDTWDDVKPYINDNGDFGFVNKFSNLEYSFDIIYENFTSYIDDFNNLSSKYENFDSQLAKQVNTNAENFEMKEGKNGNN